MSSYDQLQLAAQQQLQEMTRVVVQVGHCSQAVGAAEVAEAMRRAPSGRPGAYMVVAGCDGACFAAPQVIMLIPRGTCGVS